MNHKNFNANLNCFKKYSTNIIPANKNNIGQNSKSVLADKMASTKQM